MSRAILWPCSAGDRPCSPAFLRRGVDGMTQGVKRTIYDHSTFIFEPASMSEKLPSFRYHPDPLATGAVKPSDVVCSCCQRNRGFIYTGPVYGKSRPHGG